MGWASAGDIFDPIAQALIELGASREVKRRVLGPLIAKLQAEDWDTEDESLEQFADDVDIVALFAEHGVGSTMWGDPNGELRYDAKADTWTLICENCGDVDSGRGTQTERRRLLDKWAVHERSHR